MAGRDPAGRLAAVVPRPPDRSPRVAGAPRLRASVGTALISRTEEASLLLELKRGTDARRALSGRSSISTTGRSRLPADIPAGMSATIQLRSRGLQWRPRPNRPRSARFCPTSVSFSGRLRGGHSRDAASMRAGRTVAAFDRHVRNAATRRVCVVNSNVNLCFCRRSLDEIMAGTSVSPGRDVGRRGG